MKKTKKSILLLLLIFMCNTVYANKYPYPIYMPYPGNISYFNSYEDEPESCVSNIVNGIDEPYCGRGKIIIDARLFDEGNRTDGLCTLLIYHDALDFEWKWNMKNIRPGTLIGHAKNIEGIIPDIHRYDCNIVFRGGFDN